MPTILEQRKVEKMAQLLDIPEPHVRVMLGDHDLEWRLRIQQASTIEQARKAYLDASPSIIEDRILAMKKWLSLCSTAEQTEEARRTAPRDSSEEALAIEMGRTLLFEQARKDYYATTGGYEAKKSALEKWVNRCYAVEQIKDAYYESLQYGYEARIFAMERMYYIV